ncbi:MAG: thioredoxin domain-containing protein [Cyanobacteria bacterium]|nr:thioredoxin domain-containing protein [Cyanobacteriota bacterium]MDA0866574.1 thioredoxin domain-containing protein [Cyanobacteriota bacterium]
MSLTVSDATFDTEVLGSQIPVLVHFWAPWCGLCRMIEPLLQTFQGEWEGQVRLIDINADENLKLANQYRLTTLPTLMLFEDGVIHHRLDSFRGKEELRAALDGFMQTQQLSSHRCRQGQSITYRNR